MKISEKRLLKSKQLNTGIILFVLIGVVPFLAAFIYAVLYSFGLVGVLNNGFTTEFWTSVFQSGEFLHSLVYSILVAAVALLISVGGALWLALLFKKEFRSDFFSYLIYLPLAIPGIVTGFFVFQLLSKGGFFARFAYQFGWIQKAAQFPDLVNDSLAIGIILAFITLVIPFFLLLFLNVYRNERIDELSKLARSMGASQRQITRKVVLPILLKKTWILITLYFIFLLGAYEVPLILGQESPQMLSVLIIREMKQFDLSKISEGYVEAVVYTIIVSSAAIALFLPKSKQNHAT